MFHPHGKGHSDWAAVWGLPPAASGSGNGDYYYYAAEPVTTRPGTVPQLIFGADGHGPLLGMG